MRTIYFLPAVMAFVIAACRAGSGGDATIKAVLKHHDRVIPSQQNYPDSIFIKFNASDLPADIETHYDLLFTGADGDDHVNCTGLKAGQYYIFATGWDTAISQRVSGGLAVKLKWKQRKTETDVDVPVTE
ncbi:MAG TPA: hypothetical protein VFU15_03080 [Bacteroidia bacterium]|nr:hypothetical protein [Bacteroidia bacterium]